MPHLGHAPQEIDEEERRQIAAAFSIAVYRKSEEVRISNALGSQMQQPCWKPGASTMCNNRQQPSCASDR
jgi:hypothetical protein